MNHFGKRLMASVVVMGLTICTVMTVMAKDRSCLQAASGSDAAKPVCDKVQHINPSTKDIASPSDIMMLSADGGTFGFSIRKTGTKGDLKEEATFRIFRTYDDAASNKNALFFMVDDSYKIYTACSDDYCDNSTSDTNIYAGRVDIEGLPAGTYYLAEILAPEGYVKIPYILEVVLEDDGTVYYREIPDEDDLTEAVDGLITILNNAVLEMPGTGGIGNAPFYLLGAGIIAAAIFIMYRGVKRR